MTWMSNYIPQKTTRCDFLSMPSVCSIHSFQELTQEKHELKLKLESVKSEYETTVRELQNDISQLRHEYEESQEQSRQSDRTRAQIVHELNQQNARLAEQLNDVSTTYAFFFNIDSLVLGRYGNNLKNVICKVIIYNSGLVIQCKISHG